jgi:hypothetical protein
MESVMIEQAIVVQSGPEDLRPLEDEELSFVAGGQRTRAILGLNGEVIGYVDI